MPAIAVRDPHPASAAPVRPRSAHRIKTGSSAASTTAPQTVTIIPRRASPCARNTPAPIMPIISKGCDGISTRR